MNPADFLVGGRLESSGQFGLALPELLAKLGAFQFQDPSHAPLGIIAAAVECGATAIDVEPRSAAALYRIRMPEPDLSNPHGPSQRLIWALAANRRCVESLTLRCPAQGLELRLTPGSHQVVAWKGKPAEGEIFLELRGQGRGALEQLALTRWCGLCPVPIELGGSRLQVELGRAYRGCSQGWTENVPALFRPDGPGLLDSPRAVFLARSNASRPLWVAVIRGVSYPFPFPEAPATVGILWSSELRTDLALQSIVQDSTWDACREDLARLAVRLRSLH